MPPAPCVERRSRLGEHAGAWDDLVARQPVPSPFQRSWWLSGAAPEATYLLVLRGDRLLGGVALGARRALGITRFTAPGPTVLCPDHLDLVADPDAREDVVAALGGWFERNAGWILDVRGVVPEPLLGRAVGAVAVPADVAPWQPLPEDGDYLASRSASFRRNVRRGRRRLEDLGFTHRLVEPGGVPAALADFRRLHGDRESRRPLLAELDRIAAAVTAGAQRGEVRVDVLASADRTIAVSLAFVAAGRLSLYQVARSGEREHGSAGTVLLAAVVEDATAGGCREVDMLRGDEEYKTSFADERRTLSRLRASRGRWARALWSAENLARRVSARLRSRAGSDA